MRPVVALLIGAWVVGIVAGVFSAHPTLLGACIILFVAIAYHSKLRTPLFVASACVVALGLLYGHTVQSQPFDRCQGETLSRATLLRTYQKTFTGIQYVFIRNDSCTILVHASLTPQLVRGTQVLLHGSQVHASEIQQQNGIDLVDSNGSFEITQPGHNVLDGLRNTAMQRMSTLFAEPDASLATAMVLGDTGTLPDAIQNGFRVTGITHIISISGLHIAIIIGLLLPLVRLLPVPSIAQVVIVISSAWAYIWAIGAPPSAIRAGLFWTLFTLAYRVGRLTSLPAVMLLAVALVATIDPMIVRSVGFELSATAMVGIWIAVRFFPFRSHPILSICTASLGATFGTLPIILYYFGAVSVISPLTNILVVPVLPFLLGGMIGAVAISIISIPVGLLASYSVHLMVTWILLVVSVMQKIPHGYIEHVFIPGWGVFLYYACISLGVVGYMIWKKIPLRLLWV